MIERPKRGVYVFGRSVYSEGDITEPPPYNSICHLPLHIHRVKVLEWTRRSVAAVVQIKACSLYP